VSERDRKTSRFSAAKRQKAVFARRMRSIGSVDATCASSTAALSRCTVSSTSASKSASFVSKCR
jgi:hypothetical protein